MSDAPYAAALAGVASILAVATMTSRRQAGTLELIGVPGRSAGGHVRRTFGRVGRSRLGHRVRRDRLATLLAAADAAWTVDEAAGAKVLAPLVVLSASVAASAPALAMPIGILAWRLPEFLLGRRARRRVAAAAGEVPLFLDLLAVACSAGLAPQLAVRLASDPIRGPLAAELKTAIRRTDLGRRWRDELTAMADRLELGDLRRAAALLGRSESLGSSLADEMSRLAVDVREGRRSRATERARTAPVKMLFPLVFLILPAFLLLTVVPVLLSTVQSIG